SLMLAVLGGAAGAAVTAWLLQALLALAPAGLPRMPEIAVNGQVLAFTAAIALATAIIFGTIPALQFSRTDVHDAMKEGSRGSSMGRGWLRSTFVVIEFALALVLLVGATLLVRSFWRLQHVDLGFDPHNVLTARLWLPQPNDPAAGKYSNRTTGHQARVMLFDEILRRARGLPGVTAAASVGYLPLDGTRNTTTFTAEGHENDD